MQNPSKNQQNHRDRAITHDAQQLVTQLHQALPQTQCTRCGYPDCLAYAKAIAANEAAINQCPPGGQEGVKRLAAITGRPELPLNPAHGQEGPLKTVWIDENWCIGCTLCIKACPVDAIVGTNKRMHTVIEQDCTGCELCVPVCPVDCIAVENKDPSPNPPTGWAAWSKDQANQALAQYTARQTRLAQRAAKQQAKHLSTLQTKAKDIAGASAITDSDTLARKKATIEAILAKARQQKSQK